MKKKLRYLLFFLPIITWLVIEASLPVTFFTYRHWEALSYSTFIPHQHHWYPNIESSKNAVGDLCHHTSHEIIKHEYWKTDQLGFRNDSLIRNADIILIGDSFVAGSGLSQEETITYQLNNLLDKNIRTYNLAPCSFSDFIVYHEKGIISTPHLIIFSIVERNIPDPIVYYTNTHSTHIKSFIKELFEVLQLNIYLDKAFKGYSLKWLNARIFGQKGKGIPGITKSGMYFLNGKNQLYTNKKLNPTISTLKSYKSYCEKIGSEFLFLPLPNKETVYYDMVPLQKQPNYLDSLDSLLKLNEIASYNTNETMIQYRAMNDSLIYHLDDTHWNAKGVQLVAKNLTKKIKSILTEKVNDI